MTEKKQQDFTLQIEEYAKNLNNHTYHQYRGIGDATAKKYKLGYTNISGSVWLVIPYKRTDGTYTFERRSIEKDSKEFRKADGQKAELFNQDAIGTDKRIFVTESALDALSVIEAGGDAVGLGGVANVNKFCEMVVDRGNFNQQIILSLDNDEAGKQATETIYKKIKEFVDSQNEDSKKEKLPFNVHIANISGSYKDANEALMADRGALMADVKTPPIEYIVEQKQSLKDFFTYTETPRPLAIPTGFTELDGVLNGGLRAGLVVIGGMSALGKTTFAVQMMDHIAEKEERDVLIFSLEMSSYELRAKSVSRESFITAHFDHKEAVTALHVLDKGIMDRSSDEQRSSLKTAMYNYKKYGERVYIREAVGKYTINDIEAEIIRHEASTGRTPVVLVDYLQILQPAESGMTDKGAVSYDALRLKQISRDYNTPVVVISSFNRGGYDEPASFKSFKESGEIEYSADVVIGLQLTAVRTGELKDDAMSRELREIDISVLKNRYGKVDIIPMKAALAYNHFSNYKESEKESLKRRLSRTETEK